MSCRRPGFITCSICNATKYYSHVQRRFGQYSCEPCSKFMKRFLRDPKIFTCSLKGHCTIGKPSGEQEPRGVSVNRCKACWLKICLEKFILDSETRLAIDKYYAPKFADISGSPTSPTSTTDPGTDYVKSCVGGSVEGRSEGFECKKYNNRNGLISSGSSNDGGGGLGLGITKERGSESIGDGKGGTGKFTNQPGLSDRIEITNCDTTISPPPLPFPQRKRKPKNETATSTSPSSSSSSSSSITTTVTLTPPSLSSSSASSPSPSSSLIKATITSTTAANLINNNTPIAGESIPISTSLSGNSRNKDKNPHHFHSSTSSSSHHHHHHHHQPLHHSHQNQQSPYHSSHNSDSRYHRESSFYVHPFVGNLLTEPLCLTTHGRRSDHNSSDLLDNLPSNHRSSTGFSSLRGGHLGLSQPTIGPRYPWSHRRKDDYNLSHNTTSLTTPIAFRRELTSHLDNLIVRRGSDDDLNGLYQVDYSLTSPELVLSGVGGGSHIIKDFNGEEDGDDNIVMVGSPSTPPPLPARCGKCSYCLPTIDEKANVVVVKENVGPVRCRLAEIMSKINQSSSPSDKGVIGNEDLKSGVTTTTATSSTATSTTSSVEGQINEDTIHSSTPSSTLVSVNSNSRINRKDRRAHSRGSLGKEENESGPTVIIDDDDNVKNDDENDDREIRGGSKDGFYRKRIVSGDDDDVQGVSIKYHHHNANHRVHGHQLQGGGRSSSSSSASSCSSNKLNKSVMFNNKPYKKILINEYFVNSSSTTNNQSSNNSNNNSTSSPNNTNSFSPRDLSGPVISPDSNFLSEILNANSPFL